VLAKGLASLHNLIKQDAYTLNRTSIQRLKRHVQKLAYAAQIFFAERALLHDQNQMLIGINNEAKVRRSTRSIVLGKAKVMSFKDIKVARAARAAKEAIKGKGKRGRKRKNATLEADQRQMSQRQMSQRQSQKWRVLRERSMAGENVVGSVRVLRKRQISQS
jgi:hypothetical protein